MSDRDDVSETSISVTRRVTRIRRYYPFVVLLFVVTAGPVVPVAAGTSAGTQQTAAFAVSNLQAPVQAHTGQEVTARAVVTNAGDAAGSTTLQYRIGGKVVATKQVGLEAGESVTVVFQGTVPALAAGTYQQGVFVGDTNDGQTSSIVVGSPAAQFAVLSLQAPSQAQSGDEITVEATVRNTGDAVGSTDVVYRIDDRILAVREVSLDAGQRTTVRFRVTVPDLAAKTYRQGVFVGATANGLTADLGITAPGASFTVTGFRGPSEATVGERISARITVRNTGTARDSVSLEYRIDGRRVARDSVTVDAGASRTVMLTGTVPNRSSGTYRQGAFIGTTDRGLTANIRIFQRPSAAFGVSNLRAPRDVETNTSITVRATVTNGGTRTGRAEMQYRIGNRVVSRQVVELRPDRSTTVTFEATVPNLKPDTYRQGVFVNDTDRGQTSSLRVTRSRPRIAVTSLQAPPTARLGDRISVQVTLQNSGNASGTRPVEYRIGDRVVASRNVQVPAKSTRTVALEGAVPAVAPGTYRQGAFVDGTGWTTSLQVKARTEPRATFAVSNLQAPSSATVGARISVRATVRNTGNASGSTPLEYRVGDAVVATKRVTLEPGARQTVRFNATVPDLSPGSYDHGVFVGTTNAGATRTVQVAAASPRFAVSDLRGPATAAGGDEISVTATVTNTGMGARETDLQYRIDGEVVATETVELDPGEQASVTFDAAVPELDAGTYRQGVFVGESGRGQTSSLVVTGATPTPADGTTPGFTALAAVVAVLVLAGLALRRRA